MPDKRLKIEISFRVDDKFNWRDFDDYALQELVTDFIKSTEHVEQVKCISYYKELSKNYFQCLSMKL